MKKIVILTISEGHLSIATAIEQKLKHHYDCAIVPFHIKEFDLYLPIYQLFPSLFKVPYKLSEYTRAQNFARSMIARKYEKRIRALFENEQPDLIISTYFLYDKICADYAQEHHIPCINAVANPRTIHALEACEESDCNLVFDSKAVMTLQEYGVSPEKIQETGWFVREQFQPTDDKYVVREKLHLLKQPVTYLFTAGSDGSSTILKILPLFLQISTPLQVIFICGNNSSLYKSLQMFVQTYHFAYRSSPVRFTVLRFVRNIHEYMQASDLVIGKAGPNSVFESIACHTPFFALTHISGQEDGNLELIEENEIGIVEENAIQAMKMLKEMAAHPESLHKFSSSVENLARKNRSSAEKIDQIVGRLLASE